MYAPHMDQRKRAIEEAEAKGFHVVYGNPTTLQLDLDTEACYNQALARLMYWKRHISVWSWNVTRSKSNLWHIYAYLEVPMAREDRLFWQTQLGSDSKREALNWLWFRAGNPEECFLVETKEGYELLGRP